MNRLEMKKAGLIRVFEYESIAFKGKHLRQGFTNEHYRAFESFFNDNENTPFFSLIPHGVRFNSFVGAIHIGKLTIEVLPKAGKDGNEDTWHRVLLDMLKTCTLLTAKETGNAPLRLRSNSILELYYVLFLNELDYLIRRGLIKKYRKTEGQQKALKGALIFQKQISKNLVHKERFYTRHTNYDKNHLINQILHEALLLIDGLTQSPVLLDLIGRLKLDFPLVTRIKVNEKTFTGLPKGRKIEPYYKALEIAKLLLLNFRPDIRSGRNDMIALMFDMNMLWEEYVFRKLLTKLGSEWKVSAQRKKAFWENKVIRPDIVLERGDETYVIDTKWKIPWNNKPDDNDLKQIYVYNHHWKAKHSILLYPRSADQEDHFGTYHLPMDKDAHHCRLGFVDVLDGNRLNPRIAKEIIQKLELSES